MLGYIDIEIIHQYYKNREQIVNDHSANKLYEIKSAFLCDVI